MDIPDAERLAEVRSRENLRFEYVDEQGWDASCGYAALASLLNRYRGFPLSEGDLLARGAAEGSAVVKVSLAQLVQLAQESGLTTRAWRTDFEGLPELLLVSSPVLVHYDRPEGHFALVLAAGPDGVVTADPARGMELLTRNQFLTLWSGVVLEVLDPKNSHSGQETVAEAVRKTTARAALIERALSKPPRKLYFESP